MDREAVHAFAETCLFRYRQFDVYALDWDEEMVHEFNALGFVMDGGKSWRQIYRGDSFLEPFALLKVINEVEDIGLLGSILYTKWRYLTYGPFGGLDHFRENQLWFVFVLLRLSQLTAGEKDFHPMLEGQRVRKLRLELVDGGRICFAPGRKLAETLTVWDDGHIRVTEKFAGRDIDTTVKHTCRYRRSAESLRLIFDAFTLLSGGDSFLKSDLARDGDVWNLILWGKRGKDRYSGSVNMAIGPFNLSELLRRVLRLPVLWAFDRKNPSWDIVRIVLEGKWYWPHIPEAWAQRKEVWRERIIIDGESDTLAIEQYVSKNHGMEKHIFQDGVREVLETFDGEYIFRYRGGEQEAALSSKKDFVRILSLERLEIHYRGRPPVIKLRSADQSGLSDHWDSFAQTVLNFCASRILYGVPQGGSIYEWRPRKKRKCVYCRVKIGQHGPIRGYFTDNRFLQIGDCVMVPVGPGYTCKKAQIISVDSIFPESVSHPFFKTKVILGKAGADK